jgi:hypothetical protein
MTRRRNTTFGFVPIGAHGELTTAGAGVLTRPARVDGVIIQNIGTADATYRLDGTAPDVDTGFLLGFGKSEVRIDLFEGNVDVFLTTGARVQFQWFRWLA